MKNVVVRGIIEINTLPVVCRDVVARQNIIRRIEEPNAITAVCRDVVARQSVVRRRAEPNDRSITRKPKRP